MTDDNITEVKSKMEIVEVVQNFVKLKKQSSNYIGLCPFHAEKSGSFTVSPAKQIYKCFGCGKSGDAIQFLIDHEKMNFIQAMEFLAGKYNIKIDEAGKKKEFIKPVGRVEKLNAKKLAWFENERKISNNTLLKLGITESTEWMPQFESEKEGVPVMCFNYFRNSELVNIKFRGPQKSFKLAKDAELIFYNLDALQDETEGIIVEGEIDTATLIECGIYNVVGVPNGTPPKGELKLEYLDNCWKEFENLTSVIIAVDNDKVGNFLKEELGRRIGKDRCKVVCFPEGCKDPNEVLVKLGKQAVVDMIKQAKHFPIDGVMNMGDIAFEVEDWYENGYPEGAKSGIIGVDHMIRFPKSGITTITGIPGHGKDEFFNWVLSGLSLNSGWKIGCCGFEESASETTTKIAEKIIGKSFAFRKDKNHRMQKNEFWHALKFIEDNWFFYNTDEAETSVEGILKIATQLVLQYGIKGLIVNPWNWIEHNKEAGMSDTDYVSYVYSKLIRWSKKHSCHVFIIAHTTKMQKDKATGKYEIPTLYNVSGSANFFNKTHYGVTIYRDYESGIVTVYYQKVKQSWNGQVGWSAFNYDPLTRQYSYINSSHNPVSKFDDLQPVTIDYNSQFTSDEDEEDPF